MAEEIAYLPYQQQVIEDKKQLDEKFFKLRKFMASKEFTELTNEGRELLTAQSYAMKQYSDVLEARIIRFESLNKK